MTSEVKKQYNHYYRPFPYEDIDVYRVIHTYEITDPCIQHALKKLLVPGGRGGKDIHKDIAEAIASLQRWQAMREEETAAISKLTGPSDESSDRDSNKSVSYAKLAEPKAA